MATSGASIHSTCVSKNDTQNNKMKSSVWLLLNFCAFWLLRKYMVWRIESFGYGVLLRVKGKPWCLMGQNNEQLGHLFDMLLYNDDNKQLSNID